MSSGSDDYEYYHLCMLACLSSSIRARIRISILDSYTGGPAGVNFSAITTLK